MSDRPNQRPVARVAWAIASTPLSIPARVSASALGPGGRNVYLLNALCGSWTAEFQEFVPKHAFTRYVAKRRNSSVKRTPLLRKEVGCTVAGSAKIDEEIRSLSDALITSEEGLGR
jgi:hypothetical protein